MHNKFYVIWIWIFLWPHAAFGNYPKLWNVPLQNENFVGRAQELEQIRTTFKKSKGFQYMAITGLAGMGKTQLAKQFCHQNYASYNIVWWFDGSKNLSDQIKSFAEEWNRYNLTDPIPIYDLSLENLVNYVKNKLRVTPHSWLLVFDNVETKHSIHNYFPSRHGKSLGHVLLTSKNSTGWISFIQLKKFSRVDSKKLLKKILQSLDNAQTTLLAETLSDYPLALMQAAAFIKTNPSISPLNYTTLYHKTGLHTATHTMEPKMDNGNILDNYESTAESALTLSLNKIKEDNKDAFELALFLSHLGPREIPDELLKLWVKINSPNANYDQLIHCLLEHSLIDRADTSSISSLIYTMHEITQKVIQHYASKEQRGHTLEIALKTMNDFLDLPSDVLVTCLLKNKDVLFHAQKLAEHSSILSLRNAELLHLSVKLLEYDLSGIRDYELAQKELASIEELNKNISFPSILVEALYFINKGNYYSWKNADYTSSIKFMKKGYRLLESLDGYADEKMRSLTNLAQFEILKGNVDSASQYIQAGSQFLEDSKSDIYKSLFHFAKALIAIDQGKLEEAYQETLLEEELFKNIKDYPTLRFAQQIQKSEILIKMNQHKQAAEVARTVLEASKKFFQTEDHTITARSKVMLGLALANEGSFDKGLKLIDEAIATYNKTYQGDQKHANQAFSHKTRGDILSFKGDISGAFKEYEVAREIYKIVYANDTIDDISALYLSFVQVGLKLKDDFIVKKYFQKHLIAFGADHPRTKLIIKEMEQQK
ncbi:MAG: hypothetical protein K2X53_05030 [Alphaproteobacteria bacterium]|nr:hypothetical protein [Alphaproteobacteria bacterium]